MRKLVPFLILLICSQLYNHWMMETPPPAPEPAAQVVEAPVERPKMYYHSPLDASAMPMTAYTSMGYFSTDSSSRFEPGRITVAPTTTLVSNNGLVWGEEGESAEIQRLQSVYKLPRTGVARTLAGRAPDSAYTSN